MVIRITHMLVPMYINGTAIFLHPKILSAKKQYVLIVKSILLLGLLWYCPTPTPQFIQGEVSYSSSGLDALIISFIPCTKFEKKCQTLIQRARRRCKLLKVIKYKPLKALENTKLITF